MGIMFLIFMPVLYVDTTPVWAFPRKWPKVLVGAAGMMVELFIASLALFAWLVLAPGTVRTVLYNMIFIASVSTLLFNGNPLLRYDAYYIVADLIEIPNLRHRSTEYIKYLFRRYLLGERIQPNTRSGREKRWFLTYGVLATAYRCFIVTSIILFVASKLFFVGVAMATVVATLWVATPLVKFIEHIFFARETRQVRLRAVSVFTLMVAVLVVSLGMVPVSAGVRAPCALEPHEKAVLRAEWPGFLEQVNVQDGERVEQGQVLAVLTNEELDVRIERHRHEIRRVEARLRMLETQNQAAAQAHQYQLEMLREDLETLEERREALTVRAPFDGKVIAPELGRVEGRFLQLGEALFTVASLDALRVTAVVDGSDVPSLRREEGEQVRLRFRGYPERVFTGRVERVYPSATRKAPPAALTDQGGGPVLLDPQAKGQPMALMPWYRVDIVLDELATRPPVGVTGTARFTLPGEPVGFQFWMKFRRMLHRRFLI